MVWVVGLRYANQTYFLVTPLCGVTQLLTDLRQNKVVKRHGSKNRAIITFDPYGVIQNEPQPPPLQAT